jgi:hypothetical protein
MRVPRRWRDQKQKNKKNKKYEQSDLRLMLIPTTIMFWVINQLINPLIN